MVGNRGCTSKRATRLATTSISNTSPRRTPHPILDTRPPLVGSAISSSSRMIGESEMRQIGLLLLRTICLPFQLGMNVQYWHGQMISPAHAGDLHIFWSNVVFIDYVSNPNVPVCVTRSTSYKAVENPGTPAPGQDVACAKNSVAAPSSFSYWSVGASGVKHLPTNVLWATDVVWRNQNGLGPYQPTAASALP